MADNGLIGGIITAAMDNTISGINMALQKQQADRQWEAQQTTWNREDTAVQRRVADLKAAGLSPVLAAGSAAQTSSPIRIDAPQWQGPSQQDMWKNSLQSEAISASIANTKAQNALINAQARKTSADADFAEQLLDERVAYTGLSREKLEIANDLSKIINPQIARQMELKTEGMTTDNLIKEVDLKSKKIGIDQQNLKLAADTLAYNLAQKYGNTQEYWATKAQYWIAQNLEAESWKKDVQNKNYQDYGKVWDIIDRGLDSLDKAFGLIKPLKGLGEKQPTVIRTSGK